MAGCARGAAVRRVEVELAAAGGEQGGPGLRGFATVRPAPPTADGHRAPCELWLRYEIAGEVRTLCVEDAAPVLLGRASAARGAR